MSDTAAQSPVAMSVHTCPCCGLLQRTPPVTRTTKVVCGRCATPLPTRRFHRKSNSRTAAIVVAALVLYPFAVGMPMLRVLQFGHEQETSVLDGVASLLAAGEWFVGIVVLMCSVVFPLGKLLCMLLLMIGGLRLHGRHRALTYRIVEWTGRWGMLDVLVVALLVALIKLGDLMKVEPGPAALAFCLVVILSLLAAATFDPHSMWEEEV